MAFLLTPEESVAIGISEMEEMLTSGMEIGALKHPTYMADYLDWEKWRLTYEGGDDFIDKYLKTYSDRESALDFATRRDITYCPAFAKSGVNEVKDAIFQRVVDVTRASDSESYMEAVEGKEGGVDLAGTSMNSFVGRVILPELLTMGRVGVFLDMPVIDGPTLNDQEGKHPYMYEYSTETILNWEMDYTTHAKFVKLLLVDTIPELDASTGLAVGTTIRYRYMWVRGGNTLIQFFDEDSKPIMRGGEEGIDVQVLELDEIPFTLFGLSDSLLKDVSDYQRALLNLASSDVNFILQANFPFYVEKFSPKTDNMFQRRASAPDETGTSVISPGEQADASLAKQPEVTVGTMKGRRVPSQFDFPQFIHPSSEPLMASMKKQEELKRDIRALIKLALSALAPKMASADSKGYDERTLEAGLSAIGLELQHGEVNIARHWLMYEDDDRVPSVQYPARYSLQTDKDKRDEAKDLVASTETNPSITYKKEATKLASANMVGLRISPDTLDKINSEIDAAGAIVASSEELQRDVELTLIDPEAASLAKGYPVGSHEKAKVAHAERVARIAESQAKARGTPDLGGMENVSRVEKNADDNSGTPSKATRGEGKSNEEE